MERISNIVAGIPHRWLQMDTVDQQPRSLVVRQVANQEDYMITLCLNN